MNEDAIKCPTCGQWSDEREAHNTTKAELELVHSMHGQEITEHEQTRQKCIELSRLVTEIANKALEISKELSDLKRAINYYSNHLYGNRYMIEGFIEDDPNSIDEEKLIYKAIEESRREA